MTTTRRALLGAGLAGGAAVALAGCSDDAPEAVHRLRESAVVGSSTPYATSYVRLGPGIATNTDQVDEAVEAVSSLG